jgi:hypothetical protein
MGSTQADPALKPFITLSELVSGEVANLQPAIMHLRAMEAKQARHIALMQNLQVAEAAAAKATVEGVVEAGKGALELIREGTKWVDEEANRLADAERINEVLSFVQKERTVLEEYAQGLLQASIKALYTNANDLALALQDAHRLADDMSVRSSKTKNWITLIGDQAATPELAAKRA